MKESDHPLTKQDQHSQLHNDESEKSLGVNNYLLVASHVLGKVFVLSNRCFLVDKKSVERQTKALVASGI